MRGSVEVLLRESITIRHKRNGGKQATLYGLSITNGPEESGPRILKFHVMKTSERYYAVKHNTHLVFSLHDNNMKKMASCSCKKGVSFLEIEEFKLQSVGK